MAKQNMKVITNLEQTDMFDALSDGDITSLANMYLTMMRNERVQASESEKKSA